MYNFLSVAMHDGASSVPKWLDFYLQRAPNLVINIGISKKNFKYCNTTIHRTRWFGPRDLSLYYSYLWSRYKLDSCNIEGPRMDFETYFIPNLRQNKHDTKTKRGVAAVGRTKMGLHRALVTIPPTQTRQKPMEVYTPCWQRGPNRWCCVIRYKSIFIYRTKTSSHLYLCPLHLRLKYKPGKQGG